MQLQEIAGMIDDGSLRISVEQVYRIADIAKAHEHVERGRTRGKVVVTLDT
jgi:NADPH:quinone reductase-like Zn-dependent oxidoreductase